MGLRILHVTMCAYTAGVVALFIGGFFVANMWICACAGALCVGLFLSSGWRPWRFM